MNLSSKISLGLKKCQEHKRVSFRMALAHNQFNPNNLVVAKKLKVFRNAKSLKTLQALYEMIADEENTEDYLDFLSELDALAVKYRKAPISEEEVEEYEDSVKDTESEDEDDSLKGVKVKDTKDAKKLVKEKIKIDTEDFEPEYTTESGVDGQILAFIQKKLRQSKTSFLVKEMKAVVAGATTVRALDIINNNDLDWSITNTPNGQRINLEV